VAGRSPASPIKVWPFLLYALAVMADEMNWTEASCAADESDAMQTLRTKVVCW
jgi:hypothetical protein